MHIARPKRYRPSCRSCFLKTRIASVALLASIDGFAHELAEPAVAAPRPSLASSDGRVQVQRASWVAARPWLEALTPDVVFLVTGQSNAAGTGDAWREDPASHPLDRALFWGGLRWRRAELFARSADVTLVPNPGFYLVKESAALDGDRTFGYVQATMGGQRITSWAHGEPNDLYGMSVERTVAALEKSSLEHLSGVFWFQGEADSRSADWASEYADHLRIMLDRYRSESFWGSETFFVATKIPAKTPHANLVNEALDSLNHDSDPYTATVDARFFETPDKVHLTGEGYSRVGLLWACAASRFLPCGSDPEFPPELP
jgi:hypothetical protein